MSSLGMEGIDYSDLINFETCHLSKAQQFVSREARPTPDEPLDEVFVIKIRKVPIAINNHQHAVLLTDAQTRMRWVITTQAKDEIANKLVDWIEYNHHQFGKLSRIVFKTEALSLIKLKNIAIIMESGQIPQHLIRQNRTE